MGMQLVNFITCAASRAHPYLQFTKAGLIPRRIGERIV
jgi:hypothetical protein